MKPRINVIDLDKTLIPFDSFRHFVLKYILKCNIKIGIISLLRFLRIISPEYFKRKIIDILEKRKSISVEYTNFADTIIKKINEDVLFLINNNSTGTDTINILLSASPNGYVKIIADKLGWLGFGSGYYGDNNFIHLYGKSKGEFIKKKFPLTKYKYNFAISDSESDLNLLILFDKYYLLKNGKLHDINT